MKIVHFSKSPLAGAPYRLAKALSGSGYFESVRLVDLSENSIFSQDLVLSKDKNEVLNCVAEADIIHLHNYLHLDSLEFEGISFRNLLKEGKKVIRHFHSHPEIIAKFSDQSVSEVLSGELPSVVIAQFQERFFPDSYVIKNLVGLEPSLNAGGEGIFYSPTNLSSAWSDRWNTKSFVELDPLLKKLCNERNLEYLSYHNERFEKIIDIKRNSLFCVDDVVTGSFHLSTLEALALGKTAVSYVDRRLNHVIDLICEGDQIPIVNLNINQVYDGLASVIEDDELDKQGTKSFEWFVKHWSDHQICQDYFKLYNQLMDDSTQIQRQKELCTKDDRGLIEASERDYRHLRNSFVDAQSFRTRWSSKIKILKKEIIKKMEL